MSKTDPSKVPNIPEEDSSGLGSHLADLQRALLRAIVVPVALIILIWPFWEYFWQLLISGGTLIRIPTFWFGTDLIYLTLPGVVPPEYTHLLVTLRGLDTFSMSVRLSLSLAILFSIPWVMWNIWWFIKPGLYPHEQRFGRVAMPLVVFLFAFGLWFGYVLILPATLSFLLDFGRNVAANQFQDSEDLFNLTVSLLFVMGFVFQIPLIVGAAVRFRLLNPKWVTRHRRGLIFASAVLGAILTPTGDPVTMLLVAAPIYFLVEGGLLLGRFWASRAAKQEALESAIPLSERDGLMSDATADRLTGAVERLSREITAGMEKAEAEFESDEQEASTANTDSPAATAPESQPTAPSSTATPQQSDSPPIAAPARPPAAPPVPRAPIGSSTGVAAPATNQPADPERPVPMLPRELRRRIDHYIRQRLDEIMREAEEEAESDDSHDTSKS